MPNEKEMEEILRKLALGTNHLHKIQALAQDNARCMHLLREVIAVKNVMSAIQKEYIQYNLETCLSVLQNSSERATQTRELVKILKLYNVKLG